MNKILGFIKNFFKGIIRLPKRLIDLIGSVIVELRRVSWLPLGKLTKTTLLVLFYAVIIAIVLYAVDRAFEVLIIEKALNLSK